MTRRPKKFILLIGSLLALGLAVCVSCDDNRPPKSLVEIDFEPDPIPFNESFDLLIELDPTHFEEVKLDQINVEAIMPSHGHGMNVQPVISPAERPHTFKASGMLFHMRGSWEIQVYVKHADKVEKATLQVDI